MTTGLDALRQRIEDAERTRKQFLENVDLRLKSNDIAKIRILTDGKEIRTYILHFIPKVSKLGKKYSSEVFCENNPGGSGSCEYCDSEDPNIVKTRDKIYMWVWNYYILHPSADPDGKWKEVKRGGLKFYQEDVNKVKLLKTGEGFGGYIAQLFIGMFSKYGTLCDRDYDWIRQGSGMSDTTYSLLPDDVSAVSEEVGKAAESLEDLEGVARGNKLENTEDNNFEGAEGESLIEKLKRAKGSK